MLMKVCRLLERVYKMLRRVYRCWGGCVRLWGYLPEQLGEDELEGLIQAAIDELGASGIRDMGPVMNALRARVQGRADMKAVSQAVKARLMA